MWKPVYAQLAQMRDWLRLRDMEDTDDDVLLRLKLSAASRALDRSCLRQFGKVDELTARKYRVRWSRNRNAYVTEIDDIMDLTDFAITVDGVALTIDDDYELQPLNAIADGKPYTWIEISATCAGRGRMVGTGWWGWNSPWPDEVTESTMLQASRLNIRRDSPYGIAGGSDSGSELRLLARLDPDIAPLLSGLVRTGWVAR
jgi:hypothetical protein